MPTTPNKPCAYPGCPELIERGTKYCGDHARKMAALEDDRPSSYKRGYTRHWQKVRKMFLRANPLCECGQPATEVHHIKPLSKGGTHRKDNLAALCKSCHSKITARDCGWRQPK